MRPGIEQFAGKVISAQWDGTSIWVLTRPMKNGEHAERLELQELTDRWPWPRRIVIVERGR